MISLSTRQRQILDIVAGRYDGNMPATKANYRTIAAELFVAEYSSIAASLFVLRHKGYLRTEGTSLSRPDRWIVVASATATDRQQETAGSP